VIGKLLVGAMALGLSACTTIAPQPQVSAAPPAITSIVQLSPPTDADGYFEIAEVLRPGVLLIRQADPFHAWPTSNITVFEQSDGLVVVDAGNSPAAAERVLPMIRAFSSKPVKAIVLTHGHYDHAYGLQVFLREWPEAQIVAHQGTYDYLEGRFGYYLALPEQGIAPTQAGRLNRARTWLNDALDGDDPPWRTPRLMQAARESYHFARDLSGAQLQLPTVAFASSYTITDSIAPVEVHFVGRANTAGDAIAWSPTHRVIAVGDIVVSPVPYGFDAYANEMLTTLDRIRGFDFQVLVPGHGLPQRDGAFLDTLTRSLLDIKAKVEPLARQGLTLEQVHEQVDLDAQVDWFGLRGDPWQSEFLDGYWLRPATASVWREARGEINPYDRDLRTPEQRARQEAARRVRQVD
jgi:glyoxylase-like metal-dependent hydrolase (beta-lactamase superfamily II)